MWNPRNHWSFVKGQLTLSVRSAPQRQYMSDECLISSVISTLNECPIKNDGGIFGFRQLPHEADIFGSRV